MSSKPVKAFPPRQDRQTTVPAKVRLAPRYATFLLTGAALGAIFAALLTFGFPNHDYDQNAIFGFFFVLFGTVGLGLGGTAALLADALGRRKIRRIAVASHCFGHDQPDNKH